MGAVVPPGVLLLWQSTGAVAATEAGQGRQWCFPSLIIFFCSVLLCKRVMSSSVPIHWDKLALLKKSGPDQAVLLSPRLNFIGTALKMLP